jgi:hypothetical protein
VNYDFNVISFESRSEIATLGKDDHDLPSAPAEAG